MQMSVADFRELHGAAQQAMADGDHETAAEMYSRLLLHCQTAAASTQAAEAAVKSNMFSALADCYSHMGNLLKVSEHSFRSLIGQLAFERQIVFGVLSV